MSPLYVAVMECGPAESVEVDSVALPPLSDTVPSKVEPSKNCTVPVTAEGDTVAVNVTFCPDVDGLAFEDTEVVVAVLFTTCDSTAEALFR